MRLYSRVFAIALCIVPIAGIARNYSPAFLRAMRRGAKAEIRLVVRDDEGTPVAGASVCAVFEMPDDELYFFGKTDTNGAWVVRGKTNGNYIKFLVGKDGFYGSQREISYIMMGAEHEVRDGKWQPYGADEMIVLRRILNPVELIHQDGEFEIPGTNRWFAFDIKEMDWVPPHGNGKVNDICIFFEWDGKPLYMSEFQRLFVRFPNVLDGAYIQQKSKSSYNRYSYGANPSADFEKEFCFLRMVENGRHVLRLVDTDTEMLFRIRSQTNNVGEIVSCRYGRFSGIDFGGGNDGKGFLCLSTHLNPKLNDPNLESLETAEMARKFIQHCEE